MRGIEQFLQVDAATLGALKYAGTWNASTNTPTLASGVGVQGQYYVVSVAGSTNLDGETAWQVGDWAVFNGSVWQKVDGGSTGLLTTLTVTGNTYLATTSGDVGVGTSSPAAKLDVVGSLGIRVNEDAAGTKVIQIRSNYAGLGPSIQVSTADPLLFLTSNAERMRVTAAGDVGIGTSSPGAKLEVSGASNAAQIWLRSTDTTSARIRSYVNGVESGVIGFINGGGQFFETAGTERMRIDSSGNVGIGTSNPSAPLTVYKGAAGADVAYLLNGSGFGLRIQPQAGGSGTNTLAYVSSGESLSLGTNNTERMRIDSSGNVGIGTSSPASKLHVVGDIQQDNANYIKGKLAAGTATRLFGLNAANTLYIGGIDAAQSETLFTRGGTTQMTLDASGNLGIGVTPSERLDVQTTAGRFQVQAYGVGSVLLNSNGAMAYKAATVGHQFFNASTQAMTLDASGNLGLGVTPSAWATVVPAIQLGSAGAFLAAQGSSTNVRMGVNAYYNGGYIYTINGAASMYQQAAGVHSWHTAPSGTAGNAISFNQPMTLDASGNLGVGTSSPSGITAGYTTVDIRGSSGGGIRTGKSAAESGLWYTDASQGWFGTVSNIPQVFYTNNAERMRIDSSGNVGIGTSGPSYKLDVAAAGTVTARVQNTSSSADASFQAQNTVATGLFGVNATGQYMYTTQSVPTLFYNSGTERVRIPAAGGMVVGIAAIATNATDGFLYVPTCAGTPTGTPTTQTGTAPIVIDTTNNKLYFYSGGAWRDAGP